MSRHRTHYMDNNTRRYSRTLQDAFGPYTSREIYEPSEPWVWSPVRIALAVTYAVALITLVGVVL